MDPNIWENPTQFIPERWQNMKVEEGETKKEIFPFGLGFRYFGFAMTTYEKDNALV